MLDDLATYLQTSLVGTKGTTIFEGSMPDSPDSCICLYETGGFKPEIKSRIDYPTFQVITRNTSYSTGRAKAISVQTALHGLTETTIGSSRFLLIQAMQSPACLGQDERNRWEWSQNFKIILGR
jgi:hypothetical protein